MRRPAWTLVYNIVGQSNWIGTGWEFFNNEDVASFRHAELTKLGHVVTMRPFNEEIDRQHIGGSYQK